MRKITLFTVMALLLTLSAVRAADDAVLGVVGMNPVEAESCVAVHVPLEENEALAGLVWYNNDETVAFPEVLVSGGTVDDPGFDTDAVSVQSDVYGLESGWSTVQWSGSYRGDGSGLYVLFRLPVSSVFIQEGSGGGAAVGYQISGTGLAGWMSLDGEEWVALQQAYGLAFRPQIVAADEGTVILSQVQKRLAAREADELEQQQDVQVLRTALSPPSPNPFNPQTRLRFTLGKAQRVELDIHDVQGRLVKRLADHAFSAGEHVLTWYGRNDHDRLVGSGLYLARFKAGNVVQTQRLMLVR